MHPQASAPQGKEDEVAHQQANEPDGEQVGVPVPRLGGGALRCCWAITCACSAQATTACSAAHLEAAQEAVIHNGCPCILQQGADVQQRVSAPQRCFLDSACAGTQHCPGVYSSVLPVSLRRRSSSCTTSSWMLEAGSAHQLLIDREGAQLARAQAAPRQFGHWDPANAP